MTSLLRSFSVKCAHITNGSTVNVTKISTSFSDRVSQQQVPGKPTLHKVPLRLWNLLLPPSLPRALFRASGCIQHVAQDVINTLTCRLRRLYRVSIGLRCTAPAAASHSHSLDCGQDFFWLADRKIKPRNCGKNQGKGEIKKVTPEMNYCILLPCANFCHLRRFDRSINCSLTSLNHGIILIFKNQSGY